MFALSHHMGKCMMNFPLASYLFHIANFISHGEMHEEFPIRLFFCPFIYQLSHPMRKCMKNFSLLCICRFVRSTFTSNGNCIGNLPLASYLLVHTINFHITWRNVQRTSHWLSYLPFLSSPFTTLLHI
jgi:hypothetical protein